MYSFYSFSTSALDGGEWSASKPGRALAPGKGHPDYIYIYIYIYIVARLLTDIVSLIYATTRQETAQQLALLEHWYSTGGTRRHLRGYVHYTICITCIMHQQLWGYNVEEKLYLGVREQKRSNTTVLKDLILSIKVVFFIHTG
jgi:hypothetical protein